MFKIVCSPRVNWLTCTHPLLPLLGQIEAAVDIGGVEVGLRRQAGGEETLFPGDGGDLLLDLGVSVSFEEIQEGLLELEGVERLARPRVEVVGDKFVKVLAADESL